MELLLGFVYDVIGVKAIRKEKNIGKKTLMILGFPVVGMLLVILLLLI